MRPKVKTQKRSKRNDGWVIIVFFVMVVAAFALHFINKKQESNIENKKTLVELYDPSKNYAATLEAFQHAVEENLSQKKDEEVAENFLRKAELKHTKDNEILGTLREYSQDDSFIFSSEARIESPIQGYYYEVWLERQSPRHVLSLGPYIQDSFGNYKLDFSSILDYKEYGKVFVTIEADDSNPAYSENVVLSGDFK